MKKVALLFTVLLFSVASVYAVNFNPPVMHITAASHVQYQFDGSTLSMPVTVSGSPAAVNFLVFTKDKGAAIGKVRNGYLGWHFVDKIDTCLFVSPLTQLNIGNNTMEWNGKDEAGNMVAAGDYTYYLFGFDNTSTRIPCSQQITFQPWGMMTLTTKSETGANLTQPFLTQGGEANVGTDIRPQTVVRWVIGGDPTDASLLQTTIATVYGQTCGGIAYLPGNYGMYFFDSLHAGGGTKTTRKFSWVPSGNSVLQTDWGVDGEFSYAGTWGAGWNCGPGVVSDGGDLLFVVNADIGGTGTDCQIIYVDANDGTEIKRLELGDWWVNMDDLARGGQAGSGPTELWMTQKGTLGLGSHTTCVNQMIDPYYTVDADAVLWSNTNGDKIGDHNWEPVPTGSAGPWVCNDYNVGPYKYNFSFDSNLFSVFPSFDSGAVSFGLYGPDGTGIAYDALAGETAYQKFGVLFVDYGSAYDGLLCTSNIGSTGGVDTTIFWVGHATTKGVLSPEPGNAVANGPAAFSVAQNVPNPFNPTTTINFNLVKAGKVTVDVFNVAGQKVASLVNGSMSMGSHSVTWNASKFSAGVYFCTVKADGASKTLKMTLLK